jgi:hypothetical protein
MKIAIHQGFDFHYEMLGYILEYFISSKIDVDIYCPENNKSNEWKNFYQNIFKAKISFINPLNMNPDNYDLIFLLTDDNINTVHINKGTKFTEYMNELFEGK